MIQDRLPQFKGFPRPPKWLEPVRLGARKLNYVPLKNVRVIQDGRSGIANFLKTIDPQKELGFKAFLVLRPSGEPYVFSREQFWLAARGMLDTDSCDLITKSVLADLRGPLPDTPGYQHLLGADDDSLKTAIAELFDIHEYAQSAQIGRGEETKVPAVVRGAANKILGVKIPTIPVQILGDVDLSDFSAEYPGALPKTEYPDAPPKTTTTSEAKAETIRRTPHMDILPAGPFRVGDKFTVKVFADIYEPRKGEKVEQKIELPAPAGVNEFEITVWLTATEHFKIKQPQKTFVIHRGEPCSTSALFKLEVDTLDVPTPAEITAVLFYNDRTCGRVKCEVTLSAALESTGATIKAPQVDTCPFEMELEAHPADLTVVITRVGSSGRYRCRVSTRLLDRYKKGVVGLWPLTEATDKIVAKHFKQFTTKGLSSGERITKLCGAGRELFKGAPPIFKEVFWALIDSGKPLKTISIISEEPHVPWELMRPNRPRNGGGIEKPRDALGVEFSVARWIYEKRCVMPQVVPLTDSWIFAPNYSGSGRPKPLPDAPAEAKFVATYFSGESISPAVYERFSDAMKKGGRSLLHFVCHGASGDAVEQSIYYENKNTMTSTDLPDIPGVQEAIWTKKPFVFMNACEVGRTTLGLVGVAGFAREFIELGASCVVAPLWSVKDSIAYKVALEFYEATKTNPEKPFAEIIQAIRTKAYADGGGEDTYAAYCFYGDPLASQHGNANHNQ